jgi:hypothetical protein
MAGLFQSVLFLVSAASGRWGQTVLLVSGGTLGLTDVDALVISMAKAADAATVYPVTLATASGIVANNLLKLGVVVGLVADDFES